MPNSRRAVTVTVVICLLVPLAAVVMVLSPSWYEVGAKGRHLLDYPTGLVYQVHVADFSLYVDEETRPEPDLITGVVLVIVATIAAMTALLLTIASAPVRRRRFYTLAAIGVFLLALDELFGIHETIGYNADFLRSLPGIERPDDAVVALYALPVGIVAVLFRDVLMSTRRSKRLFGVAIVGAILAIVSDATALPFEEPLEALTAACAAGGVLVLVTDDLRKVIRRPLRDDRPLTVA